MNRLQRDQVLIRALDMVDSPSLDQKDRPSGAIVAGALSIGWLQDFLDLMHNEFPWAGIVTSTAVTLDTTGILALPATFIMDVRNGLSLTNEKKRLLRWPLQKFISVNLSVTTPATPKVYVVLPPNLQVLPTPDKSYAAKLWHYSLPATLSASTVPNFPSDWAMVEYVRLRGMEWINKLPPATAEKYAREKVLELRRSGLAHEPEYEELYRDPETFGQGITDPWAWMGPAIVQ